MWYWLMRFEGLLLLPLFIVIYSLLQIPFYIKCRKCGRWLSDQMYLRSGICEKCHRDMVLSGISSAYRKEHPIGPTTTNVSPSFMYLYTRILERVKGGKILDVGCGCGHLLSGLKSQVELYGMDIEEQGLRMAKNWVDKASFCRADAKNIPFKSNTFDCLICTEVLEHIEGDGVARECYRVLKPNGVGLITVPNGNGAYGKYYPDHVQFFTFKSITNLLNETGFEVISGEKFGLYIPFVLRFLDMVSRIRGTNPPPSHTLNINVPEFLATNFVIECCKPPI